MMMKKQQRISQDQKANKILLENILKIQRIIQSHQKISLKVGRSILGTTKDMKVHQEKKMLLKLRKHLHN